MKRALAVLAGAMIALVIAAPAYASDDGGVVWWEGNGSDNLPCETGGHWVLAPSFGIESATLTVSEVDYVMHQNGNGSWAADSSGSITAETEAYVSFTGEGDEKNHLQLSHCTEGSPTPTPTETPSPTVTPSPSDTPSTSTSTPTKTGSSTQSIPPTGGNRASPTAQTGVPSNAPRIAALAGALALIGIAATAFARRRSA